MEFKIYVGDVMERVRELPDNSINCCVTSPPYYGLRDYGTGTWVGGDPDCPHYETNKIKDKSMISKLHDGATIAGAIFKTQCPLCGAIRVDNQIGLEETPEEYVQKLVEVFREIRRAMRDDGVLWVNIGDSYAGRNNGGTKVQGNDEFNKNRPSREETKLPPKRVPSRCKPKDLIGIPWMLAFALREDGWYLRQDIIWAKNNPMPESVKDRCTRSHEYIFMLTKKRRYWFNHEAMQEDADPKNKKRYQAPFHQGKCEETPYPYNGKNTPGIKPYTGKRNKRDVWNVSVCSSVKEAHFAVFPKELIEPCILSSCPDGGTVLDPFSGSGTSGIVAVNNNKNYIGIELNPEYVDITRRRVEKECTNASIVVQSL